MARCAVMYNKVNDLLGSNKNFWKELRNLGNALLGFMMNHLNDHFAGISISSHEDLQGLQQQVRNAPLEGFSFQPVTENDVILVVSYFYTGKNESIVSSRCYVS